MAQADIDALLNHLRAQYRMTARVAGHIGTNTSDAFIARMAGYKQAIIDIEEWYRDRTAVSIGSGR